MLRRPAECGDPSVQHLLNTALSVELSMLVWPAYEACCTSVDAS